MSLDCEQQFVLSVVSHRLFCWCRREMKRLLFDCWWTNQPSFRFINKFVSGGVRGNNIWIPILRLQILINDLQYKGTTRLILIDKRILYSLGTRTTTVSCFHDSFSDFSPTAAAGGLVTVVPRAGRPPYSCASAFLCGRHATLQKA